ncbi:oxidoreductase C-terminal domain-containing protein [Amycolatopsis acidiphila]|uniref:oxidoreductase C-terminal domain-containing protein n=1 Tax=Amycolatopsis acidiphila TaxID=715473 RepID=UPI003570B3C0
MAVARNLLGEPKPFAPVPYIWSDQYDRKIQIYGLPRGADSFTVAEGAVSERKLVALCGKQGVVSAAVRSTPSVPPGRPAHSWAPPGTQRRKAVRSDDGRP